MRRCPLYCATPMKTDKAAVTNIPAEDSSQFAETRAMRIAASPREIMPSTDDSGRPIAVCAWMSAIEDPRSASAAGAKTRAKRALFALGVSRRAVGMNPVCRLLGSGGRRPCRRRLSG